MTTAFERIRDQWVPIWLKGFELNSRDYNSNAVVTFEPHTVLGLRGQFADIWRKIWKLKKAFWDDERLEGEQPLEIIDDLISHLFLTRDLLIQQQQENSLAAAVTQLSADVSDRDRLKSIVGHGWDGCRVCIEKVQHLETTWGRKFDWQEDIP